MIRIAAVVLVIGASLGAYPAVAQFGNLFGEPPPRPPADVPGGSFPPQPPPIQYPGQNQPPAYPVSPPSAIESQPLPPPRGASVAPLPPADPGAPQRPPPASERARLAPPAAATPPGATPAPGPNATPPGAPVPPPDDTVVEAPTEHIENGRAVFSGLDKITGRTISFDAAIGETVQFGALRVTARACYTRPPTEATNTDAFIEVDEVILQGQIKRIFTGWMFASSPGLHAVEHPIYDVWLTDCGSPAQTRIAEPAVAPAPAPPPRTRQPTSRQQPR